MSVEMVLSIENYISELSRSGKYRAMKKSDSTSDTSNIMIKKQNGLNTIYLSISNGSCSVSTFNTGLNKSSGHTVLRTVSSVKDYIHSNL